MRKKRTVVSKKVVTTEVVTVEGIPDIPGQKETLDSDNPQVKIDVEEARRELRKLVVVDDEEPSPEPVSTEEADAYILSFFKKKETP
jgi:hypothetical protein